MSSEDYSSAWADLASGFLSNDQMNLDFDPQAFFNDMYLEMANQQSFGLQPPS